MKVSRRSAFGHDEVQSLKTFHAASPSVNRSFAVESSFTGKCCGILDGYQRVVRRAGPQAKQRVPCRLSFGLVINRLHNQGQGTWQCGVAIVCFAPPQPEGLKVREMQVKLLLRTLRHFEPSGSGLLLIGHSDHLFRFDAQVSLAWRAQANRELA